MSQRTDGGPSQGSKDLPNAAYGENRDFRAAEASAPMAGGGGSTPAPALTPFGAPTTRPNEPVTAGAAAGAGPGPEAAGITGLDTADYQNMKALIPGLELISNLHQSNPSTRALVRHLKSLGS